MIELLFKSGGLAADGGGLVCAANPGSCCGEIVAVPCGMPCGGPRRLTAAPPAWAASMEAEGRCWLLRPASPHDPPAFDITPGEWFETCADCEFIECTQELPLAVLTDACGSAEYIDCASCPDPDKKKNYREVLVQTISSVRHAYCATPSSGETCFSEALRSVEITRSVLIYRGTRFTEIIEHYKRERSIGCGTPGPWVDRSRPRVIDSRDLFVSDRCDGSLGVRVPNGLQFFGCSEPDFVRYDSDDRYIGYERNVRSGRASCRAMRGSELRRSVAVDRPGGGAACPDVTRTSIDENRTVVFRMSGCPHTGAEDAPVDVCEFSFVAVRCSGDGPAYIAYSPFLLTELDEVGPGGPGSSGIGGDDLLLAWADSLYRPTMHSTTAEAVAAALVTDQACTAPVVHLVRCSAEGASSAPESVNLPEAIVAPWGEEGDVLVASYTELAGGEPETEVVCYTHAGLADGRRTTGAVVEIIGRSDACDPCQAVTGGPAAAGGFDPVEMV